MFVNKHFANLRVYNSRIPRIQNAKFLEFCFYMNTNIYGDFKICMSVPLISNHLKHLFLCVAVDFFKSLFVVTKIFCALLAFVYFNFVWCCRYIIKQLFQVIFCSMAKSFTVGKVTLTPFRVVEYCLPWVNNY